MKPGPDTLTNEWKLNSSPIKDKKLRVHTLGLGWKFLSLLPFFFFLERTNTSWVLTVVSSFVSLSRTFSYFLVCTSIITRCARKIKSYLTIIAIYVVLFVNEGCNLKMALLSYFLFPVTSSFTCLVVWQGIYHFTGLSCVLRFEGDLFVVIMSLMRSEPWECDVVFFCGSPSIYRNRKILTFIICRSSVYRLHSYPSLCPIPRLYIVQKIENYFHEHASRSRY